MVCTGLEELVFIGIIWVYKFQTVAFQKEFRILGTKMPFFEGKRAIDFKYFGN
jgi:hypothetical protein